MTKGNLCIKLKPFTLRRFISMFAKPGKLMLGGNIFGYFTNKEETAQIIRCAKELGIRAIDTADVYSNGISEEYIGDVIKGEREDWFIATKAGLASYASPRGLGTRNSLFKKAENSLRRLRVDYIDLYQIHHFDDETPLEETIEAFDELKRRGWIRFGGISNYNVEQVEKISKYPKSIQYHQAPLNITLSKSSGDFIKANQSGNFSVLAYSVLARGLFHEKYLQGTIPCRSRASISLNVRKDLSEEFLKKLQASFQLCKQYRCSLLAVALHWVCQFETVKWSIIGARNPEQLREIYQASLTSLDSSVLQSFETIWK